MTIFKMQKLPTNITHLPNIKYHTALKLGANAFFNKPNEPIVSGNYIFPGMPFWYKKTFGEKMQLKNIQTPKRKTSIKLRDEQVSIFEKLLSIRAGLIEATTGIGKSVLMIALQEVLQISTLIVVHSKDMVDQFYDEFKKFRNIEIGRYNTNHKDIQSITVTTFSSFSQKPELFQGFQMLIVDECDVFFTPKARNVTASHPAIRKYGFTGTIKTAYDEYIKKDEPPALIKFWGYHIKKEFSKQEISAVYYTNYDTSYTDEYNIVVTPYENWSEFRRIMDEDLDRKIHQMEYIKQNHTKEDITLILFDRVKDVEDFYKNYENNCGCKYMIHGATKQKEREKIKSDFTEYSGNILFAQYKTSSRGVDYPECNKVFLLFPLKNESTLRQAVGRVIRFVEGKKSYIYDFVDSQLDFQWKKRKKTYELFFSRTPEEKSIF